MLDNLSPADIALLKELTDIIDRKVRGRKIDTFFPDGTRDGYKKHLEFFKAGSNHKQRLVLAANRIGKTVMAAYELTLHLTGDYPHWWKGKRFTTCNHWWVVGKSSETVRQILQNELLGQVGDFGTGMIPMDALDFESLTDAKKAGTPVSTFRVRHLNGTYSTVEFKSAEQGRQAFEGTAKSIWIDEECPYDIYTECLLRTMTGDNILMMTFTPLKGLSEVVLSFLDGSDIMSEGTTGVSKCVVRATWDDAPHLSEEQKQVMLASIPPFQRDARTKGVPQLGSGAIFPIAESDFVVQPFEIPKHWSRGYGFDVGRNTAAVWIAHDREANIIYAYSDYFCVEGHPSTHTAAIQSRGKWMLGAIDTAARGRSSTDGQNLYQMYSDLGLNIINADKAVETGLLEMLELFNQGRLKVFSTCTGLLEELRLYRRDEKGQIIKKMDHRCFVGDTLVWTDAGKKRISDLVGTTGMVASIDSFEPYHSCRSLGAETVVKVIFNDGEVVCTPDHQFLTAAGWVEAQHLVGHSVLNTKTQPTKVIQCTQQSSPRHARTSTVFATTSQGTTSSTPVQAVAATCTEMCGSTTTDLFQKVTTFTTSMATRLTTSLKTLSVLLRKSTTRVTQTLNRFLQKHALRQHSGTAVLKVEIGTAPSIKANSSSAENTPVCSAVSYSSQHTVALECATKSAESVRLSVCQAVLPIGDQEVFCLEVPTTKAFAVSQGIIAHNCDAFRYAVHTRDKILRTEVEAQTANTVDTFEFVPTAVGADSWAT